MTITNNTKNNIWKGQAIVLAREGLSWRKIAELLNVPKSTLSDFLRRISDNGLLEVEKKEPITIAVIADTQCKPNKSLEYLRCVGKYINSKNPDIVVHIGDHYDFESLSSYDRGKRSFEGRRLIEDLKAGDEGLKVLTQEITKNGNNPRLVFCAGNHEDRIDRVANDNPEFDGFVGIFNTKIKELGWELHPFLKPVEICDINFVHYLANPFTGKPYSGTSLSILKNVGKSFVVGHKQCLDLSIKPTIDGKHQIGIVNGACYDFDEGYKGYQGNNHFRGIIMLHEVADGFGLPMPVSLKYMMDKYKNT